MRDTPPKTKVAKSPSEDSDKSQEVLMPPQLTLNLGLVNALPLRKKMPLPALVAVAVALPLAREQPLVRQQVGGFHKNKREALRKLPMQSANATPANRTFSRVTVAHPITPHRNGVFSYCCFAVGGHTRKRLVNMFRCLVGKALTEQGYSPQDRRKYPACDE